MHGLALLPSSVKATERYEVVCAIGHVYVPPCRDGDRARSAVRARLDRFKTKSGSFTSSDPATICEHLYLSYYSDSQRDMARCELCVGMPGS